MERRGIIPFVVAALACCSVSTATVTNLTGGGTITLSTIAGNPSLSILVGDKLFSDFTFNATGNDPVNMLGAGNITLMGRSNSIGYGIRIQGGFAALGTQNFDYVVDYTVTVTNAPFLISDLHMLYNGFVVGPGSTSVAETITTNGFFVDQLNVFDPPSSTMSTDIFLSTPVTSLEISKDINVLGNGTGGQGHITFIDQIFSQVAIPEPSSMALVAAGLASLWVWQRRRQ